MDGIFEIRDPYFYLYKGETPITKKQFENKVNGFCWLVRRERGVDLGAKYVESSIYEFYGQYRVIPRLYIKGSTFGMALPENYAEPAKVKTGMPE